SLATRLPEAHHRNDAAPRHDAQPDAAHPGLRRSGAPALQPEFRRLHPAHLRLRPRDALEGGARRSPPRLRVQRGQLVLFLADLWLPSGPRRPHAAPRSLRSRADVARLLRKRRVPGQSSESDYGAARLQPTGSRARRRLRPVRSAPAEHRHDARSALLLPRLARGTAAFRRPLVSLSSRAMSLILGATKRHRLPACLVARYA